MKAAAVLEKFNKFLMSRGKMVSELSSQDAFSSMVDFYLQERVDEADIDADGDMLLFQWGTHDWGDGEFFEYDITRQLIIPTEFEDEEETWVENTMWQLSLRLKFNPTDDLRSLTSSNKWCHSPSDLEEFSRFVQDSEATRMVNQIKATSVSLNYFQV